MSLVWLYCTTNLKISRNRKSSLQPATSWSTPYTLLVDTIYAAGLHHMHYWSISYALLVDIMYTARRCFNYTNIIQTNPWRSFESNRCFNYANISNRCFNYANISNGTPGEILNPTVASIRPTYPTVASIMPTHPTVASIMPISNGTPGEISNLELLWDNYCTWHLSHL